MKNYVHSREEEIERLRRKGRFYENGEGSEDIRHLSVFGWAADSFDIGKIIYEKIFNKFSIGLDSGKSNKRKVFIGDANSSMGYEEIVFNIYIRDDIDGIELIKLIKIKRDILSEFLKIEEDPSLVELWFVSTIGVAPFNLFCS